jgi:uncharacterized cupredoxin-like copper-binding protein
MRQTIRKAVIAMLLLMVGLNCTFAADRKTTIRVGLFDMSSVMPAYVARYGMMGQQEGPGMMGKKWESFHGMMMGSGWMSIRTDQVEVKAGAITFDVTNWSRWMLHEMTIIALDKDTSPPPYDYARAQVRESQVKILGEVSDLKPNSSKSLDVTLPPGLYLLICNLPGHYAAGMMTPLNVKP